MPIFPTTNPVFPVVPNPPNITPVPIIDTASMYANMQHSPKILPYLDGSPWGGLTYYSQYLGNADVVINSNDVSDPTLKQYLKITDFELRVTSELSQSVDSATGVSTVSGTSNVYPYITPNVGDVFIGSIDANTYGIFEVSTGERGSQFKQSAWTITYNQIDYLTDVLLAELETHVVGTVHFDATLASYGENPLQSDSEYKQAKDISALVYEEVHYYYNQFYDILAGTFILTTDANPGRRVYDQFLINFWNTFADIAWAPDKIGVTNYNAKFTTLTNRFDTIFTALVNQSPAILHGGIITAMELRPVDRLDVLFQRHILRHRNIDDIVYPVANPTTVTPNPMLSPYVVTEAIYNTGIKSPMEAQIYKALHKEPILFSDIKALLTSVKAENKITRFYFIPILISLLLMSR